MAARKALGRTQAELAAQCGVSREMWGKYERNAATPGGEILTRMAEMGIDVGPALTGERKREGDFIRAEAALRAARGDAPLPETEAALNSLAHEERVRAAHLVVIRALLMNMQRLAFNGCVDLVTNYSRLDPEDQAALVRHSTALEQAKNLEGPKYRPKPTGPDQPSVHEPTTTYSKKAKKPQEAA